MKSAVCGALALFAVAGSALAVTPRIVDMQPITDDQLPQTRATNSIVFSAIPGPYVAFAAATGALGYDDYYSTYAEAFTFMHLQRFRFVGGVQQVGGVIQFQFYDLVNPNPVNVLDVALPQAGNFIWTIGLETATDAKNSTFAIPQDGYLQLVTGAGITGQWFLSTNIPDVGTEQRIAGEGTLTTHSQRFEFVTFGGTNTAPNIPIDPTINGAATPGIFTQCGGGSVLTVTIAAPGSNPVATGFGVTADTTAVGGAPGTLMLDNGVAPDVTANDLTFTLGVNVPSGADAGFVIPVAITYTQGGAQTINGQFALDRDLSGDTLASARTLGAVPNNAVIAGNLRGGNDIDTYGILLNALNNNGTPENSADDFYDFTASCVGAVDFDSQLFLFAPNGMGLLFNDDESATNFDSLMTGVGIPAASVGQGGLVYLAIGAWGRDAADVAAAEIWLDQPYEVTRAPDGAGAANPLSQYVGVGDAGGAYAITMTGATTPCPVDVDNGSNVGLPDGAVDVSDLIYCLIKLEEGTLDLDNDGDAAVGTPDCGTDVNDLIFFLLHLESGC
jgi:hypothetical protein